MQWRGGDQSAQGQPAPYRAVLDALQRKAAPYVQEYGDNWLPGAGGQLNNIFRGATEMVPGAGDLVGLEDLQTAAQNNDWGGIGLGLLAAIPGIPAIGKGVRGEARAARRGIGLMDAAPSQSPPIGLMGRTEADQALARYQAANPADTGARVLNPGDEGYPHNAQWDDASQAYVAPRVEPAPHKLQGLMQEARERLAARAASVEQISAASPSGVRMQHPDGRMASVTTDTVSPGKYRVTYIDADGPSGHSEYDSYQGALDRALQDGYAPRQAPQPVEPDYPIRAYHGSPHSFDQFSLDAIGTGEGAQVFGRGLYFAESEDVARSYRDMLRPGGMRITTADGATRIAAPESPEFVEPLIDSLANINAERWIKGSVAKAHLSGADNVAEEAFNRAFGVREPTPENAAIAREQINRILTEGADVFSGYKVERPGSMYEVGIDAQPDTFIDWDRPLSEQPEPVRAALGDYGGQDELAGARLDRAYRNEMFGGDLVGRDRATPSEVSQALSERGINGIRYLDGQSRTRGGPDASSNYVVFNDALIKVLRKYGVSALGLGAGVSALASSPDEPAGL